MTTSEITETTRQIKRRFFALRNGMMGEQLRRAGADYRIIFGLNLPQIREVAASVPTDRDLALSLRANSSTRESQLIAPMLFPRDALTAAQAVEWICMAPTVEVVDVVCLILIRGREDAMQIAETLISEDQKQDIGRYGGVRVLWNMLTDGNAAAIRPLAHREAERGGAASGVARQLLAQIDWLTEE